MGSRKGCEATGPPRFLGTLRSPNPSPSASTAPLPRAPRAQEVPPPRTCAGPGLTPPPKRVPQSWGASLTQGRGGVLYCDCAAVPRLRDPHAVPRLRARRHHSHLARRGRDWEKRNWARPGNQRSGEVRRSLRVEERKGWAWAGPGGGAGRGRGSFTESGSSTVNCRGPAWSPSPDYQNWTCVRITWESFLGEAPRGYYSIRISDGARNLNFIYVSPQGILRHNQYLQAFYTENEAQR